MTTSVLQSAKSVCVLEISGSLENPSLSAVHSLDFSLAAGEALEAGAVGDNDENRG